MVYQYLLIITAFILLYSLFAKRIEMTALSGPVIALVVGLVFGPLLFNLFAVNILKEEYRVIAEIALALVLFTDASKTNFGVLKNNISLPTRLLLIGLPLTIVLGMAAGFFIFPDFSWIELGILATILAPTDAALGKAVVSDEAVPTKIREALNVESGLNDGISVPVLFLFIALFTDQSGEGLSGFYGLRLFAEEIGIGLLVGLSITFVTVLLENYSKKRNWISESWKPIVIIALSLSCFLAAQLAGGSGFIACFSGGFLYGAIQKRYQLNVNLVEAAEGAGDTMSLTTWLLFGSIAIVSNYYHFTWEIILYSLLSLTAIRIVPVLISLISSDISFKEKLFIGWFGPRGLASIVFAIIVLEISIPHQNTIISTIVCTVILSVVLHGFTAKPFIKILNKN
jgi:NhaP-type Na+/H+ or K+/H+ antiporter